MKKKFLVLIITIISFSCKSEEKKQVNLEAKEAIERIELVELNLSTFKIETDENLTYSQIKNSVKRNLERLNDTEIDSASKLFENSLLKRIIPRWENTPWSFEGHTSIPKKGEIACGYFVSTTLRDVGLKLNRYKLAQQSPINEAKSLALNKKIITIVEEDNLKRIQEIHNRLSEGIHFIGFGRGHVGYIFKQGKELYLIHSNYMGGRRVEIEKIENSDVFNSFVEIHLVELSTNKELLNYWRSGRELKIVQ
ncbi:hypothetical protein I2486_12490 [Cellulophaga sp. E16_2]|uniref:hypothetical protein n=1 Tax=Cellulophaga sp. E16_2 TaxID=2789297 RepID=UPI001A919F64|nr:hypothetical protein [Cellulophaga sp. E16_2]MBO0592218.1 hypothetical protein [Cellulophaga sp. E16_2]